MKKPILSPGEDFHQKAIELAHQFILTDGHIDLPWRLSAKDYKQSLDFLGQAGQAPVGDFDYLRAKAGGLSAPFMAIYIPSSLQTDQAVARAEADRLIDMVDWMIATYPDKFAPGGSPQLIEANFKKGLISLPMGLENGTPLIQLSDVTYFYNRGIRYVTLTHAKDNHICDSSYDTNHTWGGLSPFGIELIKEMNHTGVIVDVSHISDDTFFQVMELSEAPVLATHSSCRYFTPGWERNMSDEMIRLLAKKEGVIQINFGSDFLDGEVAKKRKEDRQALEAFLSDANLKADDPAAKIITDKFKKEHPGIFSDVQKVADHIDHVRNIAGIDYVGLGSDFDGLGDSLPKGLKDVSMYPNLIAELLTRGYTEGDIEKICYKNVWRVWNKVNDIAALI